MNDQRRRMKQQELKRAAAVLLEERRKARDAEKKQDQEYWKAQKEVEAVILLLRAISRKIYQMINKMMIVKYINIYFFNWRR